MSATSENRQGILDDLRQRAVWRWESADEYMRRGDMRAYEYWAGQAAGFEAAVYIIERYHPEPATAAASTTKQ